MDKEEWLWVAIRVFGLYLLVLAIMAIPDAISGIYAGGIYRHLVSVTEAGRGSSQTAQLFHEMRQAQAALSIKSILQVVIYLLFGLYFVRGGKILHRVLCRTDHFNAEASRNT